PKATLADQVNYWSNYPKFFVSLMKSFYGDAAQKENNWGYDWLPKWDQTYDVIKYFNMMDEGKVTGYFCQGFNPVASFPAIPMLPSSNWIIAIVRMFCAPTVC
ncbi:hypothetical protein ACUODF_49505, partial [Escherichia coli]